MSFHTSFLVHLLLACCSLCIAAVAMNNVTYHKITVLSDSFEDEDLQWHNISQFLAIERSAQFARSGNHSLKKVNYLDPNGAFRVFPALNLSRHIVVEGYFFRTGAANFDRVALLNASNDGFSVGRGTAQMFIDMRYAPNALSSGALATISVPRLLNTWSKFEFHVLGNGTVSFGIFDESTNATVSTDLAFQQQTVDRVALLGGTNYYLDDIQLSVFCPFNQFANASTNFTCAFCEEGFEPSVRLNGSLCEPCSGNAISVLSTNFSCTACPLGAVANRDKIQCVSCSLHQRFDAGVDSCICVANFYGPACNVFCDASLTCSGHGTCSPVGKCICSTGFGGSGCEIPDLPLPVVVGPVFDAVASDEGKGTVAAASGASAISGSSFFQLFDSLQTVTRLSVLGIQYPIWYLEFVQGFSIAMLNVKMPFMEPLFSGDILERSDDGPVDLLADSNIRLYSLATVGAYSGLFVVIFFSMLSILLILTAGFFCSFALFYAVLFLRFRVFRSAADEIAQTSPLPDHIFVRFWIFFRGLYFTLFYASVYPLAVAVLIHLTVGAPRRPVWESVLCLCVVVLYASIFVLWAVPLLRNARSAQLFSRYTRIVNPMLFDYHASFWWIPLVNMVAYVLDALIVIAGAEWGMVNEAQLVCILGMSVLRLMFFLAFRPCVERLKYCQELLIQSSDCLQLLLLFSIIGQSRSADRNERTMLVIAVWQVVVVMLNLLIGLVEAAGQLFAFLRVLLSLLQRRLRPSVSKSESADSVSGQMSPLVQRFLTSLYLSPSMTTLPYSFPSGYSFQEHVRSTQRLTLPPLNLSGSQVPIQKEA